MSKLDQGTDNSTHTPITKGHYSVLLGSNQTTTGSYGLVINSGSATQIENSGAFGYHNATSGNYNVGCKPTISE